MDKRLLLAVACLGLALAGPSVAQQQYPFTIPRNYQWNPPPVYGQPPPWQQPYSYTPAPYRIEPYAGATRPMPWGYEYQQPRYYYPPPQQYYYPPPQQQRQPPMQQWRWGR